MQFDKNIPIPSIRRKNQKYFLEQMEIGDSQEFPVDRKNVINTLRLRISARTDNKFKYRMRTLGDKVRIWRIK